jgi:hypothetical protein
VTVVPIQRWFARYGLVSAPKQASGLGGYAIAPDAPERAMAVIRDFIARPK